MDFTFLFLSSTTLSGLLSLPRRGLSAAAGGGFGLLFAPALPLPAALSFFFLLSLLRLFSPSPRRLAVADDLWEAGDSELARTSVMSA
jgi:hypothetical protein